MFDFKNAYQDIERRGLIKQQKAIIKERIQRNINLILLMTALLFTVIYGTIEDPFENTMSNIGNYYDYRIAFIVWAIFSGTAIQTSILSLFKLQDYRPKKQTYLIYLATFFLIGASLIPAILPTYPILHAIHTVFAGMHAVCIFLSMQPYLKDVITKNPRLNSYIFYWQLLIWGGGIVVMLITFSGIFQLWFFVSLLMFLLYLTITLFEKSLFVKSLVFFSSKEDPKETVEKVFFNYEREFKKKKKGVRFLTKKKVS